MCRAYAWSRPLTYRELRRVRERNREYKKKERERDLLSLLVSKRDRRRERNTRTIRKCMRTLECSHQSFIGHWLWDIVDNDDDDWPRRRYLISAYHTCFAVPYLPALCLLKSPPLVHARSRFVSMAREIVVSFAYIVALY